jgi:hypothetical protein
VLIDSLLEWLRDVFGWVLTTVTGLVVLLARLLYKHSKGLAMLEQTVTQMVKDFEKIPAELRAIKEELRELRNESRDGREALRLELKADINRESDRRAN